MSDVSQLKFRNRAWQWGLALLLLGLLIVNLGVVVWQRTAPPGSIWASSVMRLALRILLIVLALLGWFRTQALIGSRGVRGGGIGDGLQALTAPWNDYLRTHPRVTNGMLIVSSAGIDLFGIFLIGAGIFGPTLRPFIALLLVFVFRQLCQAVCALPVPTGMIWRNPGFPSLLVTYNVANDFFISGHTAIAVLGAIEIGRLLPWWCGALAGVVALLEAGMVIVLRAHYTMDVLAAALAAWGAAELARQLCLVFGL